MSCSTPVSYAVGLVLVFAFAFWVRPRWDRFIAQRKDEEGTG